MTKRSWHNMAERLLNVHGLDEDQRFFAVTWLKFWLIRHSVSAEDEERYRDTLIPSIDYLLEVHHALLSDETVRRCELSVAKWQELRK